MSEKLPPHTARRTEALVADLRDANEQLVISSVRTNTELDEAHAEIDALKVAAHSDALTSLPDRSMLRERLEGAIAVATAQDTTVALLFVDLDDFKSLNDRLGHDVGDELLVHAATVLVAGVGLLDTVSRRDGDEFTVLLTDIGTRQDVASVASRLLDSLRLPVLRGGELIHLGASVGISMFPGDGRDLSELLDLAEAAMYRAKRRTGSSFVFHGECADEGLQWDPVVRERSDALESAELLRAATLREANEQLVLAVLTAQDFRRKAEEAHQRQAQFMAVLAHELRNPLAPIRSASAVLGTLNANDGSLARMQGVIERQVAHLARLVDDLLDVSRLTTGKLSLVLERLNIDEVVTESVAACRSAFELRQQGFTLMESQVPIDVTGDRVRLSQVLTNLLDNASKYTPDGGDIGLEVRADRDHVTLRVRDSGIGIAAASLPRIFDLFEQDPHAVGFNGAGLGIGLTVVRELVQAHGGTVTATSSTTGTGSEFTVTLPRARSSPHDVVTIIEAPLA